MSTPSLPLLTAANWYLWEQQALNSMTIFCHAGPSIQTDTPFMLNEPCKPLRMFYLEKVLDPETQNVVILQSSRLWNDATGWPLYHEAKEDYHSSLWQYQQHRQAFRSFLLTHIDADADHLNNGLSSSSFGHWHWHWQVMDYFVSVSNSTWFV